ncbi:Uncharacterized conserved protein [Amycolatopsis xylanica]|uniref:Uncharacterized conserved protein n=1 Tax=Amycolatopsis xylanica TaxID=589385 RepID=A0A1H3K535_9PSEU|nr:YciI family protein [Amycolatopsis xylanica]SDY47273.1 Uncharacterized conserved protein [Amycolatopsis xylanica]
MKYLILVLSNEKSRAAWETLSEQQQLEFGMAHRALSEQLAASGELVYSEGLVPQEHAKRVSVRDGQIMSTDGPFAEVKECLAGYYLVDVPTIERAVELAALVPDAALSEVEVRPVFEMSMLDEWAK